MQYPWLVKVYMNRCSFSLRNFKETKDHYNFSCPFCGDSKANKSKARGYLFTNVERPYYYCHNCKVTKSFNDFLSEVNPTQYEEYRLEKLKSKFSAQATPKVSQAKHIEEKPVIHSLTETSLLAMGESHPAVKYVKSRLLPLDKFFWTENFRETVLDYCKDEAKIEKYQKLEKEPRLCVHLTTRAGDITGVVGRSLEATKDSKYRYLTVKVQDTPLNLFGLDTNDRSTTTYAVEGAYDSMFLPNAIAMCGNMIDVNLLLSEFNNQKLVVVLDNEPRKKETLDAMLKYAKRGLQVAVWHDMPEKYKDINDMILAGYTRDYVKKIIDKNTFTGIRAVVEINSWKKRKL